MNRDDITDLLALQTVAAERSFTRAAARLGVTQSALSQTISKLEARLGIRLLTRTTRSLSATEAGERLLRDVAPHLEGIESALITLSELRGKPAGTVRITTSEHAANTILWPKLSPLLAQYADLKLELVVEHGFTDIAGQGFDAGVRLGESVEKDMIAVRIGPDLRMVVVGAPEYFRTRPVPLTPQDLTSHQCITARLPSSGTIYVWEFEKDGHTVRVKGNGQLVLGGVQMPLEAVLGGFGLCCMMEDFVAPYVRDGRLKVVLDDWSQPFSGFHLYYPSRRQMSPALALVVDALRYRA